MQIGRFTLPFSFIDPMDLENDFLGFMLFLCYMICLIFLGGLVGLVVASVIVWTTQWVSGYVYVAMLLALPFLVVWKYGVKR